MKLSIPATLVMCALSCSVYAAEPAINSQHAGPFYVGIFGGVGASNEFNVSQYGTAYYLEASDGPLAVNAFGHANNETSGYFGAQLGYRGQSVLMNPSSQWLLEPAGELEGFSMNSTTFNGSLSNNTSRAPEHNFSVSYPMNRTIFLANAVMGFNNPHWVVQPYVGLGIGGALLRISSAYAAQVAPPEANVNHYNGNPNASNSAFAGQVKLGLNYDINQYFSVFAEYRWLYIASSNFTFGSTVYTGHPETSSWQVNMDAQRYNMADIGLRVSF